MLSVRYCLIAVLLLTSGLTSAYANPSVLLEAVNQRIDTFDEVDRLFKALRFKVVSQRSQDSAGAREFSSELVELAYRLPVLFEQESPREVFPHSRSRPEIWSRKVRFDVLLDAFIDNLEIIDDEIAAGNLTKAGQLIDETAKGCRRCHNAFRYR